MTASDSGRRAEPALVLVTDSTRLRGRDLATGLPIVAIWQAVEARRLLHRRDAAPTA